jgi:predicted nucleic acid-binding protein
VPDLYQKPYLDSSVFIAWIKGEVVDGVERGAIATHVLHLAERQRVFRITTSALTLAEVHKPRHGTALAEDQDERIVTYFEHDFIDLIQVDRQVGAHANALCRQHGLTPNDAIHLACALRAGCDVLLAWDGRFTRVQHAQIRIEEPQMVGQLHLPMQDEGQQHRDLG